MSVRSRGSLLAGRTVLAGLLLFGLGCHASSSDHDAFALHNPGGQANTGFAAPQGDVIASTPMTNQPVVRYSPAPAAASSAAPVTLHPVPVTQAAPGNRDVIASSWQPVQRVSAEQPMPGPDPRGSAPNTVVARSVPAMPARMPVGTPAPGKTTSTTQNNGPMLGADDPAAAPGSIVLPAPRPLGSPPPTGAVIVDGMMPPHPPVAPYPNVPREFEKMALPPYVVEPPDILLIQASNAITLRLQPIQGPHPVSLDGTVSLGIYGRIRVVGLTLDQIADAVAARLLERLPGLLRGVKALDKEGKETKDDLDKVFQQSFTSVDLVKRELQVDVLSYNSKFYYIITDGGGYGQQVFKLPITGNETVLDALANIYGLPTVADKRKVWLARATRAGQPPKIMPVDWVGTTKCGESATNYQLFPGDRVYVDSSRLIKADTFLAKLYSPVLRTFGVTLLGASTVNTIKLGTTSSAGGLGGAAVIR